jgi:hypothetical protein
MKRALLSLLPLVACLALVGVAFAQAPADTERSLFPFERLVCPDNLLRACCDFYCPKPQPCVCCYCFGRSNDCYCCKPQPCIDCFRGPYTCDCYCGKQFPNLCRPIFADYFRCVPKCGGGVESSVEESYADSESALIPVSYPADRVIEHPTSPVSPDLN